MSAPPQGGPPPVVRDDWTQDSTRLTPVVVLIIFSVFATAAVALRLWARRLQRSKIELNDYLAIAGLVWILAESVFSIHSFVYWDLGYDPLQSGPPDMAEIKRLAALQMKGLVIGQVLWATGVFFVRASIISLYIRIFRTKSFRIACYIAHAFNFGYFVSIIFGALLICRPLSAMWDPMTMAPYCGDQKAFDLYLGVLNLLLDVTVVVLPMPVLWRLKMSTNKKVVLSGIFGMGIIICIITLIRIRITYLTNQRNAQRIYALLALLTCLEGLLGVINACLPVMKPVFTTFGETKLWSTLTSRLSTTHNSNSTSGGNTSSNRYGSHSKNHRHSGYYKPQGSMSGREMPVWPSSPAATMAPVSERGRLAPRFMDSKAVDMMYGDRTILGNGRPQPPPKHAMYVHKGGLEGERTISVKRDWDVERADSWESDEKPLRGEERGVGNAW